MKRLKAMLRLKLHRLRNMKLVSVCHTMDTNGDYNHSTIYLHSFFNDEEFLAIDYSRQDVWRRGSEPLGWQVTDEVMNGDIESIKRG